MNDNKKDNINPEHYKFGSFETIDVITEVTKDLRGIYAVDTANIIKYITRWNRKNGVEDLKKARWYLDNLINNCEKEIAKRNQGAQNTPAKPEQQ